MSTRDKHITDTTIASPAEQRGSGAQSSLVHQGPTSGLAQVGHFLGHLGEMTLAMIVGMGAAIAALAVIFSTVLAATIQGMTRVEVFNQFAVLICLVMVVGMTVPMVAWMRFRGMAWRPVVEMAAAMVVPAIPIIGLFELRVIPGVAACCLYCALTIPAMIVAMLLRLDLYTGRMGHLAYAA